MTPKFIRSRMENEGVCVIQICRPDALNAIHTALLQELKLVLTKESENSNTRVLIITGEGEKAFIAGADIVEMQSKSPEEAVQFAQLGHEVTKLLELMPKPTIAAVQGYALGGGTEVATSCDFIIASETAVFGQPEVTLGVIPGFGGTLRLSKFVGLPRAKELIYTGKKIRAPEALRIGLVNQVFPTEKFLEQVLEIAQTISRNSATAIARSKTLLNEFSESTGLNTKLDAEAQAFGHLFGSDDQVEGMNAFVAKRKPLFKGLNS